jgi:hypothetical protein
MTRLRWALIGMCVLLIAACGNDGRTLREPDPGATAPPVPRSSTTTSSQIVGPAGSASTTGFELTSSAFAPGAPIPVMYTCDGDNVSPPLAWESVPAGTVELALTDVDPDANNFVHWVMAGIDPTVQASCKRRTPPVRWDGPGRVLPKAHRITTCSRCTRSPPRAGCPTVSTDAAPSRRSNNRRVRPPRWSGPTSAPGSRRQPSVNGP